MKKITITSVFMLLYIICLFGFQGNAYAEWQFSYETVKPENQQGDESYYNLKMSPGQTQKVQLKLTNHSDKEQTVEMFLNGAKTNSNGVIEYGPTELKNDASLKYDFKDLVSGPTEVALAPNATVPVELTITMPNASFDGRIIGGIYLKGKQSEEEKKAQEKKGGVSNAFAYVVAMVLQETDTSIKPELKLNKVYAGLSNYRGSFFANFSNVNPTIIKGMTVDMQVMKKGSDKVLYDTKRANMEMAPNSMIDFPLELNGDRMEAGDYKAHIVVTTDGDKWEWNKAFKVSSEDAEKYNSRDVSLVQKRGLDWKLIASAVGGIFALFLVIFFIVRTMSKKKQAKQAKQRKQAARKKKK